MAAYRYMTPKPLPPAPDFDPSAFVRSGPALDAPYVTTDYAVVDAMLAMAEVRPGDQVIDLGSGDGRILIAAARSHGARGLGVDIDPGPDPRGERQRPGGTGRRSRRSSAARTCSGPRSAMPTSSPST